MQNRPADWQAPSSESSSGLTPAQASLLQALGTATPGQIAYFSAPDLRCLFANQRYAQACGHTPQAILGQPLQDIVSPTTWQTHSTQVQACLAGQEQHYTCTAEGLRGDTRHLEVHLVPHCEQPTAADTPASGVAGSVVGLVALILDTTHRWAAENAAKDHAQRLRKFNDASQEVIIFHQSGVILDANQAAERITGYSIESLRGRSIFDLVHPQDRVRVIGLSRQLYEEPYEAMVLRRDGSCIDLEITGKNLPQPDGSVQRIVVGRDISSRKQAQAQTVFMTQHDLLTGLPNRQHLLHYAEKMLQQLASQKISTALFFINLDHFKTINDSLGHFMGDEVLQTMAQRLKASMRPEDFVARLSGDEFVILLSSVQDENQVKAVAEKLLLTIAAPHTLAGMPISLSPSIGISLYPNHGLRAEELLRHANQAMTAAKEYGRANYQIYAPFMTGSTPYEELLLERELREALENHQLQLHYQPQICLKTGALAGFEALVRWQHPQRGILGPLQFIPFAEKRGLIASIGRWVLFEACRQLKAWHDAGLPKVPVAVNLSPLELRQRDVLADIQKALATTGLAAQYLEVEITESVLMQQSNPAQHNILRALQALGVGIAIDDFGTGYSSLAYLKRYPIDKLKIDRSFITDTPHSVDDVAIVTAIIQMGRSLQLQVLAEGVETAEQQALLTHLGCDLVQGFGLSRPLPAHQVPSWWHRWGTQSLFD